MINPILSAINETLTGYTKTFCLLERSAEGKTVQYSGGGSFNTIPFDTYNVGGYWRLRSNVAFTEAAGTIACSKKQTITYPLYFVAWFRRDDIEDSDQFAQLTTGTISGLRTPSVRTQVRGYAIDQQQTETGKINDSWMVIRFDVDVVFTKICPTTCATVEPFCKLLGSINDVLIGNFFSDFNIQVVNQDGEETGQWNDETGQWEVTTGSGGGEVTLQVNGTPFTTITAPDTYNLPVLQRGVPVGEKVGDNWVVPDPEPCEDATYTVRDQFGNDLADGSIASGAHADIELEIPQTCSKLINGAVSEGAGTPEANGTWIWNEDTGQYENENGLLIHSRGGVYYMFNSDATEYYYSANPEDSTPIWALTWGVFDDGVAPAPTFTQATEPCTVTFRVGDEINGYATWEDVPADTILTIPAVDQDGSAVVVSKNEDGELEVEMPEPVVPTIIGMSKPFRENPQSQKYAGFDGVDYYTLSGTNYFGNTLRYTGKTGGGYNGSEYVDVNGDPTTDALAYPDDMVLIHDMIGANGNILCMKRTVQGSALYADHISASDALVHGGIGPNRWFLGSISWYFRLADNIPVANNALSQPPFNITSTSIITTDDGYSLNPNQTNSYRPEHNSAILRTKTSNADGAFYWCWINPQTDL